MKLRSLLLGIIVVCGAISSCGVDNKPLSSDHASPLLTVMLKISPPTSLRTLDTWNFWNVPLEAAFVVGAGDAPGGDDHGHGVDAPFGQPGVEVSLLKISSGDDSDELTGTVSLPGMVVNLKVAEAASLWELQHGGEMHEHHPEAGDHHVEVEVIETATGHHAHGGVTVSHCEVTLIAISATGDTTDVDLVPVQSGHGFRYESNAALPFDTYDVHLEIEPPAFFRTDESKGKWTSNIEVEFEDFVFDGSFTSGTVGTGFWIGPNDDSLKITLRAGSAKTYGAVGMGALPLAGDESINFSLRLEDPLIEAHGQPLYGTAIIAMVTNGESGKTTTSTLNPAYGEHGFYFGGNMDLELGAVIDPDDHGNDGDHGPE